MRRILPLIIVLMSLSWGRGWCGFPDTGSRLGSFSEIGTITGFDRSADSVTFNCQDNSKVCITLLAPDLARVRASFKRSFPKTDHSWAIEKTVWPVPKWTLREEKGQILIATDEMEIAVTQSPLLIEFRDAKTHMPINSDARPMLYNGVAVAAAKKLSMEEHFYGLGEKAARLDRRRGKFTMWNTDSFAYSEGTDPLYQDIPFYIGLNNGTAYGIFFDNSYRSGFDLGNSGEDGAFFYADGGEMNYYFFLGPGMKKIISRYTELTGRMPLPPLWALGHQQCRYSYYPASLVEEIADKYRKEDLPLDVLYLDIHYMNDYRVFTWNPKRFPDPGGLVKRLNAQGIKVVNIVDPGVKYQPVTGQAAESADPEIGSQDGHYYVYDQGMKNGYFLKREDGTQYFGSVWPGTSVFTDFTRSDASEWWGGLLRAYTKYGVSGIWNDMNEPSDFNDKTGEKLLSVVYDDMGENSTHAKNRNVYGLLMAKATYNGLLGLNPNQRPFVITRAAYAGIQRYSSMWTGDNTSTWDSLALSLPMLESLGLSGEAFAGADIGGFYGRSNGELVTRWYEVNFLVPFCRNHKCLGDNDQEPWRFGGYYEDIIRKYLKLRYRLMPFIYTQMEATHRTGVPTLRPLLLDFQGDKNVLTIDDQFLIGSDLLAAPILASGREKRSVYLPQGQWYDFWTRARLSGGQRVSVNAPLETAPLFVRGGSVLPLGPEMNYVGEKPADPITFKVYPDAEGHASGSLYEDDGLTNAYLKDAYRRTEVTVSRSSAGVRIAVKPEGTFQPGTRQLVFELQMKTAPRAVSEDGKSLSGISVKMEKGLAFVTIQDEGQPQTIVLK